MKKLITFMMSLLIMTTMTGTNIHADDSIGAEGDSVTATVGSDETLTDECVTDEDVFRVTVSWNISPGTYARNTRYSWNAVDLKYDVKKELTAADITTTDGTAEITLTNYSNTDVDYSISYEPAKAGDKAITSEEPTTEGTDIPYGTIASADSAQTLEGTGNTYKQAIYNGTISYASDYMPENEDNEEMGSYTVKISKHLTLNKETLTIKKGRTSSVLKASTPVTWTSSNENIATVDATGKVTAVANGTANITATSTVTGLTSVCTITVRSDIYGLTDSQEDFDLLLASDTVDFTYNDVTYTAYNGFIKETAYATWYQAQEFVNELNAVTGATNTTKVLPDGVTDESAGSWILLSNVNMAYAWIDATGADSTNHKLTNASTVFGGGVSNVWTSECSTYHGRLFCCGNGSCSDFYKTSSNPYYGFVVIWQPASN